MRRWCIARTIGVRNRRRPDQHTVPCAVRLRVPHVALILGFALKPWQEPPCCVVDPNEPRVGEEEAAKLLRRMLKAGISRWHPDPLRELERREKA
jgi:hypothetical protein